MAQKIKRKPLHRYVQIKKEQIKKELLWARHAQVFEYLYNQEKNEIDRLIQRG